MYPMRRSPFVPTPLAGNPQQINDNGGSLVPIGYTTGAGTAVVQSGTTGSPVTANAVCGNIQTVAGSWAAGLGNGVAFSVVNSQVSSTDTIIVNQMMTTGVTIAFVVFALNISNGSFTMGLIPVGTATSLASLNFSVIKAVAS